MGHEPKSEPLHVASFGPDAPMQLDADHELWVRGSRVTRAGGWLRIGASDEKIPRVLQWITVHLRVVVERGHTKVSIDRVRFGDVEWQEIDRFLHQFDGVWAPHLVEQTRRAITRSVTADRMERKDGEG
jgi:hypothetical protein